MRIPEDQFKINLNQNLWGLLLGFTALGVSEYFKQWGGVQKKKAGRLLDERTWDEMPVS